MTKHLIPVFITSILWLWGVIVTLGYPSQAQPTLDDFSLAQLPSWSQSVFDARSFRERFIFDLSVNPFIQSADFDGDGFLDLAVLVRDTQTGQRDIALLRQEDTAPQMLVANMIEPTDDLAWLMFWHVERRLPAGAGLEHDGHILVLSGVQGQTRWLFRDSATWHSVLP